MGEEISMEILEYLRNTKDFVLEQSPEILQEALRYHYISNLCGAIFFIY